MSWQHVKVGDLITQVRGVSYSSGDAIDEYKDGYVELLRANNIADGHLIFDGVTYVPKSKVTEKQYLKQNDIVIAASSGSISVVGKAASFNVNRASTFGAFCKVLRPNANVDTRYIANYFQTGTYRRTVSALAEGANINNLRNEHIDNLDILLPPLAEQKRIAAILDKAAEIKAKREQAIAKLDALTSSTFTELFLKDDKWPTLKLMEVCTTTSGGTPKRDVSDYYGGEIFWVKSGELNADLVLNTEETLTLDGVNNSSAKVMPPKTVLLAMYGATIGAVSMLGVSAATNQAICCITTGEKLLPEFLVYYLKSIKNNLIKLAVGGAQPNINQDIVRNLVVPIPPESLQKIFLNRAMAIRQQIIKAKVSLAHIETTITSLQHQAFTTGFNA